MTRLSRNAQRLLLSDAELRYAKFADATRMLNLAKTFSGSSLMPPPVLDLNYADKMALYGIETFARTATETYKDMAGVAQTAATGVAAFDRQAVSGLGWVLPKGLKTSANQTCTFNPTGILPTSGYTIVADVDRPTSFTGAGTILSLNGGSATNRIDLSCTGNYQSSFVVQAGGTVVVNQSLGNIQDWYGGPRRLVIGVASGGFYYSDDGQNYGSVVSGSAPAVANLTQMNVGYTANGAGSGFTGWIGRIQILPFALTSVAQAVNLAAGYAPVACWGDSLTFGTGSAISTRYPEILRLARHPHSSVYNGGVGGDTSTQIRTRMLADTIRKDWTSVFWAGRNNTAQLDTVVGDVQAMVNNLTHNRFLVMSVINKSDGTENAGSTAYNQIVALNAALQAAFPNNYLDIRSLIVAASGGSNDAPNPTWTSDGLHLNSTSYPYVGAQSAAFLGAKGWY